MFDSSYVVLESHTVVAGDSYDFHLVGARDGCIIQSDECEVVMVVLLFVVCHESGCGFFWCYFKSVGSEPCL